VGVDQLAAEDSEVAEYVQTLEEARDTAELPEASGEAIAREFERYLRRRDAPGGKARPSKPDADASGGSAGDDEGDGSED
ncbi:PAC2 family protein, partial [Streptomyces sp. SID6139]|nr:PAC2 family protein [Streptomyces sp. SID6139]